MSDKELDEILEEIKNRSQSAANEPAENIEASEPQQSANAMQEIIKMVSEDDEPEQTAEPEAEIIPEPEVEPEAEPEPEIEPEAEAEPEEDVSFSLPEEAIEETEAPEDEEIVFTIPPEEETDDEAEDEAELNGLQEEEAAPEEEAEASEEEIVDEENGESDEEPKKGKKPLIIAIIVILIIALGVGIYFGFFHKKDEPVSTTATTVTTTTEPTTEAPTGPTNPFTGESGYNSAAIGKRPVAVVVENEYSTASVRPQWGLNKADIVLEGESEFSTRLLLFWADYTNMPEQIGPTRSARPPYIRFSQLFDSIFIHAGLSKSKGNYVGANTVFKSENVDHINLLTYSENGEYFGRDKSRTSTIEHTGYLNGTKTAELIQKAGIKTTLNESKFSTLEFNETAQKLSDTAATSARFIWSDIHSSGHCPKTGKFYYDESLEKYTTSDFDSNFGKANLEFENLIFLLDKTEYVVKANYKGSGNSETYCDYKLSGGKGTILSHGTALEITWGVSNGKLWMKDSAGNAVKLNPGKSYIGYGSSNHGGSVTLNFENR